MASVTSWETLAGVDQSARVPRRHMCYVTDGGRCGGIPGDSGALNLESNLTGVEEAGSNLSIDRCLLWFTLTI